jgi:putative endonuclease
MLFQEGFHTYYIYILTNKPKSVFYTGVTNNLRKRLNQHQENILLKNKTFASKYNVEFYCIMKGLPGLMKQLLVKKKLKVGEERKN